MVYDFEKIISGTPTGSHTYPQQSSQENKPHGESNFVDGSGPLFSMYLELAEEEDKKMAESWKADADAVLVFTGLFSAAVAALIAVSIQDLRQDKSSFYLANIYRLLADANGAHTSLPSQPSDPSISVPPPTYAVWVNSLWFLSLSISLTCALLATLLQQWARRYIKMTQSRYSPHKRAHIRAFFAKGIDRLHLPWAVDALPLLLHLSLSLFFAGLLVFLFNVNHTVFSFVAWWVGLCVAAYLGVTFMPMFRHDSPYYTPLSSLSWCLVTGFLYVLFRVLQWITSFSYFGYTTWRRFRELNWRYYSWFLHGQGKAAEETAQEVPPAIGSRILAWTLESLDEDHELERFFAGIPSFCGSTVVDDPLGTYIKPNADKLSEALFGLLHRTLSSNLIPEPAKQQRIAICKDAMEVASFPINQQITLRVLYDDWVELLGYVGFGLFLRRVSPGDARTVYFSRCMVAIIIAGSRERDGRWFELASSHLGVSRAVLRYYLAHGHSMHLANCVHTIWIMIRAYLKHGWARAANHRSMTLETVTKFDVRQTLPELQLTFCLLWNEVVCLALNTENRHTRLVWFLILRRIHNIHIDLHQGDDASPVSSSASDSDLDLPSPYRLCNVHDHHNIQPDSISLVSEVMACTTDSDVSPLSIISQLRSVLAIVHSPTPVSALSTPSLVLGSPSPTVPQLSSSSPETSPGYEPSSLHPFPATTTSSYARSLQLHTHLAAIESVSGNCEVTASSAHGILDKSAISSATVAPIPLSTVPYALSEGGLTATPLHALSVTDFSLQDTFTSDHIEHRVVPDVVSSLWVVRSPDSPTSRSNDIPSISVTSISGSNDDLHHLAPTVTSDSLQLYFDTGQFYKHDFTPFSAL